MSYSRNKYDEEFDAVSRRPTADELEKMLETANTQHAATMERLKNESDKAVRLEQQNAELRGDLDSLSNKLDESKQQRESQLGELVAELDRLAGSVAVKEGKLEEAKKSIDELEKGKREVAALHQDAVSKLHERNHEIEQEKAQMLGQIKEQETAADAVKAELQTTKEKFETLSQQLEADSSSRLDPMAMPKTRAPLVKRVPGNEIYVRYNGHVWRVNPSAKPPEGLGQRVTQLDIQPDVEMTELDDIILCELGTSWTSLARPFFHRFIIVMGTKLLGEWSLLCGRACYDAQREQFYVSTFHELYDSHSSTTTNGWHYEICPYPNSIHTCCFVSVKDSSQGVNASKDTHKENCQFLLNSAQFNLLDKAIRSQLACRIMTGGLRFDVRLEYDSVQEVALVRLPTGQHSAIVDNIIRKPGTQTYVQKLRFVSGISGNDWRPHAAPSKEEITAKLLENEQVVLTVWDESMITTKLLFLWRRDQQPESAGYMTLAYKVEGGNSDGNGDSSNDWRHTPVYAHYGKSRGRNGHEENKAKLPPFLWYTENEGRRSHRKLPVSKALIQYCGRFAKEEGMPGASGNN